jgi:post-segregation antitoxin (ccd killing protein)
MGQDAGSRQACNLSLPSDLVQQARRHTDNLSGTVEVLLAAWVTREQAADDEAAERTNRLLRGLNQLRDEVGSLADDFSPL